MAEGARPPRLRGVHVQRPGQGPPGPQAPTASLSVLGPRNQHGLETDAQMRQVASAGSLNKVSKTHHVLARESSQRPGLKLVPVATPQESAGAHSSQGRGPRSRRLAEGRSRDLGCPGGGASRGRDRAPVFVAPCQLHCNKSGAAAPPACTPPPAASCRLHGTCGQQHPGLAAGGRVPGTPRER